MRMGGEGWQWFDGGWQIMVAQISELWETGVVGDIWKCQMMLSWVVLCS